MCVQLKGEAIKIDGELCFTDMVHHFQHFFSRRHHYHVGAFKGTSRLKTRSIQLEKNQGRSIKFKNLLYIVLSCWSYVEFRKRFCVLDGFSDTTCLVPAHTATGKTTKRPLVCVSTAARLGGVVYRRSKHKSLNGTLFNRKMPDECKISRKVFFLKPQTLQKHTLREMKGLSFLLVELDPT